MTNEEINAILSELNNSARFIGSVAYSSLCIYNSASRAVMMTTQKGQTLTIKGAENKILLSGLEQEYAKYCIKKEIKNESQIVAIICKDIGNNMNPEVCVMYFDLITKKLNMIEIPINADFHQHFTFRFDKTDTLKELQPGNIVEDALLAKAPDTDLAQTEYKIGMNARFAKIRLLQVAEDGAIACTDALEKMAFKLSDKRSVEFGSNTLAKPIYDGNIMPNIGEYTHESGALMVLSENNTEFAPVLKSFKNSRTFSPTFDKVISLNRGVGLVTNIKAHFSPRTKGNLALQDSPLLAQAMRYVELDKSYNSDIIRAYEKFKEETKGYTGDDVEVHPNLARKIIEAYVVTNKDVNETYIKKKFKNGMMDVIRLEFDIEYTIVPTLGYKITDLHGERILGINRKI